MKQLLILIIFICSLFKAYSQQQNCGWYGTMKPAERMKQFPFNKAKRIVLVSYPGTIPGRFDGGLEEADSTFLKVIKLNFDHTGHYGRPDKYKITQEIEITGKDIDSLSNLLINYTVRKNYHSRIVVEIKCYVPRNGVVFYDENDKIICFLEVCFECMQYYILPDVRSINHLNNIDECGYERVEYLQEIFKRNGLIN